MNKFYPSVPKVADGTGFLSVIKSVVGAMFGIQSSRQREKDFNQGKPWHFIIGGLLGVTVFIMTMLFWVNSMLPEG